ncbi:MAG: cytochrome c1, partial [Verrucomicrobiaceae bacterium]|nr:cytochrome c1 [Verrucomicrobiaceae bacterium]
TGGSTKKKPGEDTTGMPLLVKDEAVVYRNFIATAGNRSIGVGYPGGFNLAWNAETMNLVLLWRGAFIDAARHWNGRGAGPQPPAGYDVLRPAGMDTLPFATLSSPGADWPKLEPKQRAAGYQFKGYRLDAARRPTFSYEWNGVRVTDRFDPEGSAGTKEGKMIRTLTLTGGVVPENTWLRIATGKCEPLGGDAFTVDAGGANVGGHTFDNKLIVTAPGATLAGSNLVMPVKTGTLKVTYQWLP